MEFNKIFFEEIDSTNKYVKENYRKLNHGDVIIAKHQTAGRGRMGRSWEDDGSALFSILLKDNLDIKRISELSIVIAASMYETITKYADNVQIKWPNDILINGKKVCGILLESVIKDNKLDCLIIGVGVNVNTKAFSSDLHYRATSLYNFVGKELNIESFIDDCLFEFNEMCKYYNEDRKVYIELANSKSFINGKDVIITYNNNTKIATAKEVCENGNLLVILDDQELELTSGEVSLTYYY